MHKNYQQLLPTKDQEAYNKTYLSFESDSVDFALNDFVDNFLVVPATFDWMDVGSFQDLYSVYEENVDANGNAVKGAAIHLDDVQNSLVRNEEDKPVAVIGLDNVAVINTPSGVLIVRKDLAQKVKQAAEAAQKHAGKK